MNKAAGLKMRRRLRRERRRAYREAQAVKPSHSFLLACLPEDVKPWAKQLEVLDAVAADAAFDNDPEDDELQRIELMLRTVAYRRHHQY